MTRLQRAWRWALAWWRTERVEYRPVPWHEAFVIEVVWRGVICHRYQARGVPGGIEFRDERDGSLTSISGTAGTWKLVLPDEIVHAEGLPPLGKSA